MSAPHYAKAPAQFAGQRVRIHRNLHKACWALSIGGKVLCYLDTWALTNATPVILPSGARRAVERGTRTVHAYVEGTLVPAPRVDRLYSELSYRLPPVCQFELNGKRWLGGDCHGAANGSAWAAFATEAGIEL